MRHIEKAEWLLAVCSVLPAGTAVAQPAGGKEDLDKLKSRITRLEQETEQLHKEIAALREQVAAARQGAGPGKPPDLYAFPGPGTAGNIMHARLMANQNSTAATLKMLVMHESIWRQTDQDRNGQQDYWTRDVAGFRCLHDNNDRPLALIDITVARADVAPGTAYPELGGVQKPKYGYSFKVLKTDQEGKPYLEANLPAPTAKGAPAGSSTNQYRFAFCAFPATYGTDAKLTFVVNEEGVVWQKDLGPDAKGVDAWPNPEDATSGWKDFAP